MKKCMRYFIVFSVLMIFCTNANSATTIFRLDDPSITSNNVNQRMLVLSSTADNIHIGQVADGMIFDNNKFSLYYSSGNCGLFCVIGRGGSELNFEGVVTFSNNLLTTSSSELTGGIVYASGPVKVAFGGNTYFYNNALAVSNGRAIYGGTAISILAVQTPTIFDGNVVFEKNTLTRVNEYTAYITLVGSAILSTSSKLEFKGTTKFIENIIFEDQDSTYLRAWGNAISNYNASSYLFHKDVLFAGNAINARTTDTQSMIYGGAIYSKENNATLGEDAFTFNGEAIFTNNTISANTGNLKGGAIYSENSTFNFNDSVLFRDNGAYTLTANNEIYGGAIYLLNSIFNFNLSESGKNIVFENNYIALNAGDKELNSIYFGDNANNSTINFEVAAESYVNIRDAIAGEDGKGIINKKGDGSLYLWGDNSNYSGQINVNGGSFYAMFDKIHDAANDPQGQRTSFDLGDAKLNFAAGSLFRPMMISNNQLVQLNEANTNVAGKVDLVPYNLSSMDTGTYNFSNAYSQFGSWESDLAKITIGSDVEMIIKRDLKGYENLSSLADAYRKRDDLSLIDREELDNIYYTGQVTDNIQNMFEVAEGEDYINYEQVHRASVRQFNRQIVSRVQNKNCPTCGIVEGYSSEHLWFNAGQNWIEKDTTSKSVGYEYKPTSFAIGYDYDFIPRKLNVGIAASYAFGEVKTKSSTVSSKADVDEYLVSLYGKYKPLRAYITANIGGGIITNDTKFNSVLMNTKGSYNTRAFFANTELGYDFGNACGVLEPYIGFEYTHLYNEGYTEKGNGARHFNSMNWDIFEVPVGVRISRNFYYKSNLITPALDFAYSRNFGDKNSATSAYLVGNAGDVWRVVSNSDSRDSFRGTFNLKINNQNSPFALNFGYARDWRSDYTDDQIYATIRYNF